MKKIIIIIILVLFSNCVFYDDEVEIGRIENYDFENDIPEFENVEDIAWYLGFILPKYEDREYWQLPEETYNNRNSQNRMTGDCEDVGLLGSYILETKLNIETNLLIIKKGSKYHVVILLDDEEYGIIDKSIIYKNIDEMVYWTSYWTGESIKIIHNIPYEEAIWMTMYYHRPVGKYEL